MPIKILFISDYRHLLSARPEAEVWLGLDPAEFQITLMTYREAAYAQKPANLKKKQGLLQIAQKKTIPVTIGT